MSFKVNYQKIALLTANLVKAFGAPVVLVRSGQQNFNVNMVILEFTAEERENSLIQYNDRKGLIVPADLPTGVVPSVETDRVLMLFPPFGQKILRIVTVNRLIPNNTLILYQLQLRDLT